RMPKHGSWPTSKMPNVKDSPKRERQRTLRRVHAFPRQRLESEDGAAFAAEIAPSARRIATEKRQSPRGTGQSIGLVEPLFKGESDPIVQFVIQGAGVE